MPEGGSPICEVADISPRFLLRDGSCMQMNITSLMVLEWLLTSL